MQIGTFGDIVFEVGDAAVRTFENFHKTAGGRWAVHEPILARVRPEYLGPSQGEVDFQIRLSAALGVNPRAEIEKLETMAQDGTVAPIIIGGRPVSDGDWYIESCETTYIWVNGRGQTEFADVQLNVREYF